MALGLQKSLMTTSLTTQPLSACTEQLEPCTRSPAPAGLQHMGELAAAIC